jgi:hypothetical protein
MAAKLEVQIRDLFIKDLQANGLNLLLSLLTHQEANNLFTKTFKLDKLEVKNFLDTNENLLKPGTFCDCRI